MKKLKSIKVLFIVWMMFCTNHIIAQGNTTGVPSTVIKAFTAKYPKAEVKNWNALNNEYTARAKENGHGYYATFDQNGKWIKTTTKVNWPWHLPLVIKTAFKKSKYGSWNIYTVRIVEEPTGQLYQLIVDDRNHPVDMFHDNLVTENRVVDFKSNGEFITE